MGFARAMLSALVLTGSASLAAAQTWQISSGNTTLNVSGGSGYSFSLVENETNQVLLRQEQTQFVIGGTTRTVSGLSNVSTGTGWLSGTLAFSGTSDTANVKFTFTQPGTVQVDLWRAGGTQPTNIAERFDDLGERYYGVWEKPLGTNLDNRGESRTLATMDHLDEGVYADSARAPFYLTSNKVGVYVQSVNKGNMGFGQSGQTKFDFNTRNLTYHLMYGQTPKEILGKYNQIAGSSFMPPDWSLSTIWWRDDHTIIPSILSGQVSNAQQLVIRDADRLRELQIPAGAIWIDRPYASGAQGYGGFDFKSSWFPNPDQMVRDLDARGMKLMMWVANRIPDPERATAVANGWTMGGGDWPAVDMRKQAAYDWYKAQLDRLMDDATLANGSTGIAGYKVDRAGEGELSSEVINEMVPLFNRMLFEGMQQRRGDDFLIFARSVYDTTRQYAAHWNGDPRNTFEAMETSVKNAIRCGLINFPMWGSDTGGYHQSPTKELQARWTAFSAYSPMMEFMLEGREKWLYGTDAEAIEMQNITRKFAQAHHDMLPYTRSGMNEAVRTGVPLVRAMFLEFPNDPNVADMADQYMFGPSMLVAPVVQSGVSTRQVYLPGGRWVDYENKKTVYQGGQTITASAPLDVIPVFVREGAIIPRGDILQANNNWSGGAWKASLWVEFFLSKQVDGEFDYFTGEKVERITAKFDDDVFTVNFGDLGISGWMSIYLPFVDYSEITGLQMNGVPLTTADYFYDAVLDRILVPFSGPTTLVLVPEPMGLGLMALGAVALLRRKRVVQPL